MWSISFSLDMTIMINGLQGSSPENALGNIMCIAIISQSRIYQHKLFTMILCKTSSHCLKQ